MQIRSQSYPKYAADLHRHVIDLCDVTLPFIRSHLKEAPGIPSVDANLCK